jgi:hypothetical protein
MSYSETLFFQQMQAYEWMRKQMAQLSAYADRINATGGHAYMVDDMLIIKRPGNEFGSTKYHEMLEELERGWEEDR